jgi:3-oxoacyl-[acyl-carrier protein] reductase
MFIVITGASKGIGFEMVKEFAKQESYVVLAISRNVETLTKLLNKEKLKNVFVIKADITNITHRKKIVNEIRALKIPVDVLINNAGQIVNKPFESITIKELQSVYNTNIFAPFGLIQAILPMLNKKVRTHIVNISSMGGFQGSSKFAGLSAYSSSKAALAGLSECLAEELKAKNVAVNCLAIGAVQTEMLSKAFPNYKAPLRAHEMASFICDFAIKGSKFFNGKIIPVSSTTP